MKKLILTVLISMFAMTFLWSLGYKPISTTIAQLGAYYSVLPADTLEANKVVRIDDAVGDHSAHPSLNFGDGDAGLYESADDILNVAVGGVSVVTFEDSGATFDSTLYIASNSEEFRFFASANELTIGPLANTDLISIMGDTAVNIDSILQVESDTKEFRLVASGSNLKITDGTATQVTVQDSGLSVADTIYADGGYMKVPKNILYLLGRTGLTVAHFDGSDSSLTITKLVLIQTDTTGQEEGSLVWSSADDSLYFHTASDWHQLNRIP